MELYQLHFTSRDGIRYCAVRALQTMQKLDCALRMGRGSQYGPFVLLQHHEPALNIGRMIGTGLRRQCQMRA